MQTRIEPATDGFLLRLPKEMVEACGLTGEVTVTQQEEKLVVEKKPRRAREGWEEALRNVPQEELDRDFEELRAFREMPHEWDDKEWQWPAKRDDEKV